MRKYEKIISRQSSLAKTRDLLAVSESQRWRLCQKKQKIEAKSIFWSNCLFYKSACGFFLWWNCGSTVGTGNLSNIIDFIDQLFTPNHETFSSRIYAGYLNLMSFCMMKFYIHIILFIWFMSSDILDLVPQQHLII